MPRVVVFTLNNARILAVADASEYAGRENCVIDPDLSHLRGVPPHHWRLAEGKIYAMNQVERNQRDRHIKTNGAINHISLAPAPPKSLLQRHMQYLPLVIAAALFAAAILVSKGIL